MGRAKLESVTTTLIAKKAGCSQSTVSMILNGKPKFNFSDETCKNVRSIAEELGYQTFAIRKAVKKKLKHIGFVVTVPDGFEQSFMSDIFEGVCSRAEERGYLVVLKNLHLHIDKNSPPEELEKEVNEANKKMIDLVKSKLLDGILVDKSRFGVAQLQMLEKASVPFVCINGGLAFNGKDIREIKPGKKPPWVCIDHFSGSRTAIRHLINMGHKRIAMLMQPLSMFPAGYTPTWIGYHLDGYIKEHETANLIVENEYIREVTRDREDIIRQVQSLMSLKAKPTAIFIADSEIASSVVSYFQFNGIKIPEDISVISYDSRNSSSLLSPRLTNIEVPWKAMGIAGAEKLINLLEGVRIENTKVMETKFIDGESVKGML